MLILLFIFLLDLTTYAYTVETNQEVHQYLTNESKETWKLIPSEIKDHLITPLNQTIDEKGFKAGEDTTTGSGEEDKELSLEDFFCAGRPFCRHFWQPDNPGSPSTEIDDYDDGLASFGSSYRKALELWQTKVIPNYLNRNFNESYYWLGRVAHLLEDTAQQSHVHLDSHGGTSLGGTSILEDYTGSNFSRLRNTSNWKGNNFAGQQYHYENLIDNFNWSTVEPKDKQFIELFRLFWYTAQKTQYWASDDNDGNMVYEDLDGNQQNWQCEGINNLNLWKDFNYTSCNNFINNFDKFLLDGAIL